MCKDYMLKVNLEYGEFNIEVDTYNEMMDKYKKLKEDYRSLPCTITAWSNIKDMELFTKKCGKEDTFESLYNNLINTLVKIGELEYENIKDEISFNEIKFKFNHSIEEINIFDEEEILNLTKEYKNQLTKRRIVKTEGKRLYAFHDTYLVILDELDKYRKDQHKKENEGVRIFRHKPYYKEKLKTKLNRISKVIGMKPFNNIE